LGGSWEEYDHDIYLGQYSIIAQFQNNEWQKIGVLNEAKSGLSAILHNGEYLIIGGDTAQGDVYDVQFGRSYTSRTSTRRLVNRLKIICTFASGSCIKTTKTIDYTAYFTFSKLIF